MALSDLIEFVVRNPVVGSSIAVVLSVSAWKTRRHIARHRAVGVYARKLQDSCDLDENDEEILAWDGDRRHEFQDEIGRLADELDSLTYEHGIKDERLSGTIDDVTERCDRLRRTWLITKMRGMEAADVELQYGVQSSREFLKRVEDVRRVAAALERDVKVSFIVSPVTNAVRPVRSGLRWLRNVIRG